MAEFVPETTIRQSIRETEALRDLHLQRGELRKSQTGLVNLDNRVIKENDPQNPVLSDFDVAEVYQKTAEQLSTTLLFLRRGLVRANNPHFRNYSDEQIDEIIEQNHQWDLEYAQKAEEELKNLMNLPKTQQHPRL